ncbi:unnamed protein product [Trichogramma brassicae]|uniref:CHK kinase-like domain-containing protein n=1 Tax=Trichogramma brassicae TaxID=86971 RepID=A0A6H5IW70_9HYME|nr:unnamed protein product [Trichogramma brassicae]
MYEFSPEEIRTIVRNYLETDSDDFVVVSSSLAAHSTSKVGFMGDHRNLVVEFRRSADSPSVESKHFFLKTLPAREDSANLPDLVVEGGLFDHEAEFFNRVAPLLKQSLCEAAGGEGDDDDFCPRCYLANGEILVLEDLRDRGYAMCESKLFGLAELKAAARALARLHASGLLADLRGDRPLLELYPGAFAEILFTEGTIRFKRLDLAADLIEALAGKLGRDPSRVRSAVHRGFAVAYRWSDEDRPMKRCVTHGDPWPNNMLVKGSSDEARVCLVDFQLCRYGPRTIDLAELVYLSTRRETREMHEGDVLEAYHRELTRCLGSAAPADSKPSLEDIRGEYEELRLTAMYLALMYLPVICIDKKIMSSYTPQEINDRIVFRQSNDEIIKIYESDPEYAARIDDVLGEYIDYLERIDFPAEYEPITLPDDNDDQQQQQQQHDEILGDGDAQAGSKTRPRGRVPWRGISSERHRAEGGAEEQRDDTHEAARCVASSRLTHSAWERPYELSAVRQLRDREHETDTAVALQALQEVRSRAPLSELSQRTQALTRAQ